MLLFKAHTKLPTTMKLERRIPRLTFLRMTQTEVNPTSEKTNLEISPLCMALKQTVGFFSSPVTRVSVICEAAVESNPELLK